MDTQIQLQVGNHDPEIDSIRSLVERVETQQSTLSHSLISRKSSDPGVALHSPQEIGGKLEVSSGAGEEYIDRLIGRGFSQLGNQKGRHHASFITQVNPPTIG